MSDGFIPVLTGDSCLIFSPKENEADVLHEKTPKSKTSYWGVLMQEDLDRKKNPPKRVTIYLRVTCCHRVISRLTVSPGCRSFPRSLKMAAQVISGQKIDEDVFLTRRMGPDLY